MPKKYQVSIKFDIMDALSKQLNLQSFFRLLPITILTHQHIEDYKYNTIIY